MTVATPSWFYRPFPHPEARQRLCCFSYAGRGASLFRNWGRLLGSDVDVVAIQMPGRENRLADPAFNRIGQAVAALREVIAPLLDRETSFFGHSLGATLCFDLARALSDGGSPEPRRLIVSGARAPHVPSPHFPIHGLGDAEFLREVQERYGGIPREILENPEVLELLLPTLRADFEMLETYRAVELRPMPFPIHAFGGKADDDVREADIDAWRRHSAHPLSVQMFEGGHFFVQECEGEVVEAVRHILTSAQHSQQGVRSMSERNNG
jgi:medium-chain acyl-[acyl-carrier-protein] hydrolase